MAQIVKYVDVKQSYIPQDPNSYPDGMQVSVREDDPGIPVIAHDGKNFLPTSYGYKSFFGTETEHPADALAANIDFIIVFQNNALNNILIAFTASGIWTKAGDTTGAWTQEVILDDQTDELLHFPWTYCILNDKLYAYRSNGDHFYEIASQVAAPGYVITEQTPTFLNMAAQMGIFRAGNRLGFWDSANSVGWSSLDDFEDFTPNLETLAGNSIFSQVMGRIVIIKTHGDGFIIYATKSIVYVAYKPESINLWEPKRIMEKNGISYMQEVVEGMPNTTHFAYTTAGLYEITNASPELIIPEITDFLKLMPGPKYLKLLEGRYLFFEILDPNFINAFPQQTDFPVPALSFTVTAETFAELLAQAQGETPELTPSQFLQVLTSGMFNQPPTE